MNRNYIGLVLGAIAIVILAGAVIYQLTHKDKPESISQQEEETVLPEEKHQWIPEIVKPKVPTQIELLLQAHNKVRSSNSPLKLDPDLMAFAQKHAEEMARRHKMRHSHLDFPGSWSNEGENIAEGQPTVDEVMSAWMHSSGHRRNILNKHFTQVGFGISTNNGTIYWCVDFGTREGAVADSHPHRHRHVRHHQAEATSSSISETTE